MDSYEIRWKSSAEKDLRKIDRQHVRRIIEAAEALADNPNPKGSHKLYSSEADYRIRVGDYRVIYPVDKKMKVIIVYHIRHRRKAYSG